jgi:hypothetical protein
MKIKQLRINIKESLGIKEKIGVKLYIPNNPERNLGKKLEDQEEIKESEMQLIKQSFLPTEEGDLMEIVDDKISVHDAGIIELKDKL